MKWWSDGIRWHTCWSTWRSFSIGTTRTQGLWRTVHGKGADCPTVGHGASACRPRLTGEVAGGGSGNGFECGFFLWVPKDMENLFWLVGLTCMESTKL